jgi:hypothetical protein
MVIGTTVAMRCSGRRAGQIGSAIFLAGLVPILGWGYVRWAAAERMVVFSLAFRHLLGLAAVLICVAAVAGAIVGVMKLCKLLRGTALGELAVALKKDFCPIAYADSQPPGA